jgi:hypothetical protein
VPPARSRPPVELRRQNYELRLIQSLPHQRDASQIVNRKSQI